MINSDIDRQISEKYCPRFGQLAIEMGIITEGQRSAALRFQLDDERHGRPHRRLGRILFDNGWMTATQIEQVLNGMFQRMRTSPDKPPAVADSSAG